ncbi:MAG: type II toxin-antitoxin system PemK/MazF family toxin [Cyanobacteria bacterium J06634_6]
MHPKPGEVWLADLGLAAKTRPVVIVSREDPEPPRALVTYIPLTTQNRGSEYEVALPKIHFLKQRSFANTQGIGSIPIARLERKRRVGHIKIGKTKLARLRTRAIL